MCAAIIRVLVGQGAEWAVLESLFQDPHANQERYYRMGGYLIAVCVGEGERCVLEPPLLPYSHPRAASAHQCARWRAARPCLLCLARVRLGMT